MKTVKRLLLGVILAALCGLHFGYLGAYIQYWDERIHGANYGRHSAGWGGLLSLPGEVIAARRRGYDYCLAEQWPLDRHRIALYNAAVYAPLGLPTGLLLSVLRNARQRHA